MDITVGGAVLGGILSFLSPCVLPLVPPYLCYIGGLSYEALRSEDRQAVDRGRILLASLAFVAGFALVFMAFGATATVFGQLAAEHAGTLAIVAGLLIMVFGLHFLGVFRIGLLYRQARVESGAPAAGPVGAFVMGLAFAFGWTPCVGPILAAILFVAGAEESIAEGMLLLAAYAGGIGIPFILAALFTGQFITLVQRHRRWLGVAEKISGGLLVGVGILFMTGGMSDIAFWLLDAFPALGRIG